MGYASYALLTLGVIIVVLFLLSELVIAWYEKDYIMIALSISGTISFLWLVYYPLAVIFNN